ncbi:hypothetical protein [Helicobacter sp. 23-1045]
MQISNDDISQVAEFFSIVHHIPGRIRIRVNVSKIPAIKKWAKETPLREILGGSESESAIIAFLQNLPLVRKIKVNALIGSATIEYDKTLFAPNLWESWVKKESLDEIAKCFNEMLKKVDSAR